jgi:hypothetical protein
LAEKIDKRYEAVNEALGNLSVEKIWGDSHKIKQLSRAKTGMILKMDRENRVLSIDFVDRINIEQKVSYMETISDVEHLKNYFHYSLRSLRKHPFYTDDYEIALEQAFEERLKEITDLLIDQVKSRMALVNDFKEIHDMVSDLNDRALHIGFTEEQRQRLNDLYELRKDKIKRAKLEEINLFLDTINDTDELRDYWNSIKWFLLDNRTYLGKEFETLIAKDFDEALRKIQGSGDDHS